MSIAASPAIGSFIGRIPEAEPEELWGGKALSQGLTAQQRAANRLLATKQRHPLPVGGASSGKIVVRIRRLVAHRLKAPGPCQRLLALPVEH